MKTKAKNCGCPFFVLLLNGRLGRDLSVALFVHFSVPGGTRFIRKKKRKEEGKIGIGTGREAEREKERR